MTSVCFISKRMFRKAKNELWCPQGSVRGLLLFPLIIRDKPNCLKTSEKKPFADEAQSLRKPS